ncbi:MAG: Gfo/Idh/MocA family oxidoreductase, partial [Verrucomicrobia bacterium]|nr:Gfo/Idh/MocA family oxidoreductase [Verrucomicrobiota bacterium]
MNRTIKWGVIGSGGIARRRTIPEGIVPASNAELAAVFDLNAEANQAVAKQFKARAVASVDELLGSGIEAVYIASPPPVHR